MGENGTRLGRCGGMGKYIVPVGNSLKGFADFFAALGPFRASEQFWPTRQSRSGSHSLTRTTVMAILGKIGNKPIYSNLPSSIHPPHKLHSLDHLNALDVSKPPDPLT